VQPPDLEAAHTNLADTLGPWTYALVAGLAFLETGAFVGLIAPGETAIVLGGVIAAQGAQTSARCS
jgi:membrane protein DedA with SNARE-associated domain